MPRLFASITRFSIWSLMPSPWRPPIAFARGTARPGGELLAVRARPARRARSATVTFSGSISTRRVPVRDAHDRLDDLHARLEALEVLRLVRRAEQFASVQYAFSTDVPCGEAALLEVLAHLLAAAERRDERLVEPRLVDAQRRVREQAVAVEALDVVALVGRAVAEDVDAVLAHRAHERVPVTARPSGVVLK